ncbi:MULTISPECIES: hypothetical protein [Bacillus cereus group]|jgi:hypothetical protein|uniref:Integrase n=1 Tax=Bacillus toyonensis TaxID=155322 RepID=A0AB73RLE4_9BACI|nr:MULTISPECIES: hypothetical protein [Bacillus cereus group]MBJ7929171.1 hypothetical protein [Bacillus cereus group sp. N31]PEG13483.1 hypothetical protein COO04_25340 [Bacillus toyonensis]PEI82132.1 hypothetical protein CN678_29945 [Bacillus toyonensis]PEK06198.1 hypothetical protein CN681_27575 [Bacillus toyonensis]PEL49442.1 hypothetical protein CN638_21160 [Bacillus toyonensis]
MEKNNVGSVCLFLQLLTLRVQKMFIKKELKKYTWQQYMNILLHDAYHTGQIIQLRKLQGSWPTHRSYL